MPTYKTTGLVLKRINLGEADRIITFMTPDLGKVKAVARGVRRIKSRQAGHLELFSNTQLMLAVGRNLDVVASARLENYFPELTSDFERLSQAYLLAEIVDKLVDENQPQSGLHELMLAAYTKLNATGSSRWLEVFFKLRLLEHLGYKPQLEKCVVCSQKIADGQYWFDSEHGGIVDEACVTLKNYPLTGRQSKLWRLMLATNIDQLTKIGNVEAEAAPTLTVIDGFYEYLFGKRFLALKEYNVSDL